MVFDKWYLINGGGGRVIRVSAYLFKIKSKERDRVEREIELDKI